jgi:hypothetical protein
MILESIRPLDGWIGHCAPFHFQRGTGITQFFSPYDIIPFPTFHGVGYYQDRFAKVYPTVNWPTKKSWHHKARIPIGMHT